MFVDTTNPRDINVLTLDGSRTGQHSALFIDASGYDNWVALWTETLGDHRPEWVLPDLPGHVAKAAALTGLALELVAERLRRELGRSAKEHGCATHDGDDRCHLAALDKAGPWDPIDYSSREWNPTQQTARQQWEGRRAELTHTVRVHAAVPTDTAELWQHRTRGWLADAAKEIGRP